VSRGDWSEKRRSPPAAYACALATDRFWRDPERFLIGTHPGFPDLAEPLAVDDELAHALLLVVSRLPEQRRRPFADAFYERQASRNHHGRRERAEALALAAGVALLTVGLAAPVIRAPAIVDLLQGAAQGDDLARTPEPALAELRKAVASVRYDLDLADPESPAGAASIAVAEVLDPSSDDVALQEVVARAAYAAVESWDDARVLEFLLDVDLLFAAEPARI
jgi:hypothetical protein